MSPCQRAALWQGTLQGLSGFHCVQLQRGVQQFSWIGVTFPHHCPKQGKVWSHMLAFSGQSVWRACPDVSRALAQIQPYVSFYVCRGTLGKAICRHCSLHLVRSGKINYLVRLFQCHKQSAGHPGLPCSCKIDLQCTTLQSKEAACGFILY